jgi:fibronectin-binding autotransporter adhesin
LGNRHGKSTIVTLPLIKKSSNFEKSMKRSLNCAFLVTLSLVFPLFASAAQVVMTNSDSIGTSSFNSAGHWSNGSAPAPGNAYYTGDFILRTPSDGNSYTFAGDSLTVNNGNGYPNGLLFKGTGTNGVITINNLILSGGYVSHADGIGDVFQLAGTIDVISNSTIYAKQGDIYISSVISGTGNLTIPQTDAPTENARYVHLLANNSAYTGKIVVNGKLDIASDASLGAAPSSLVADQLTLDGGWLSTTNNISFNANRGITLGGGGGTITNFASTLTIPGPISGSGNLDKRGGGVLALSGNNSFSGNLTLYADTTGAQINIDSPTAIGSGQFVLAPGVVPAVLDNTSGTAVTLSANNLQIWENGLTFLGSSSLNMGSGSVLFETNVTVTVSNNTLMVGAIIDDGVTRSLTKAGPGTFTVNGGITFLTGGDTTVNEGALTLTGSSLSGSPVITVASNAVLDVSSAGGLTLTTTFSGTPETLEGGGTVVGNVADDGSSAITISPGDGGPGTLTINGSLTLNGGSTIDFDLGSSTTVGDGVNDLIAVANQLGVLGHTTLNVVGIPTIGAYTLFQYGTFSGSLANFSVPPGYALTNNTSANAIQLVVTHVPANLTWRGDGTANVWDIGTTANWIDSGTNQVFFNGDSATFDDTGSNTPAINLTADVSPASVTVTASKNYTLMGGGIVAGDLTKSGTGKLILDDTNSYPGSTIINSGTLQLGDYPVTMNAGTIGTGPVTNNGNLVFDLPTNVTVSANVSGSGGISDTGPAGTATLSGNLSGSQTVSVLGSGTLTLSGSNSYNGLTLITNGTLEAHGIYSLGSTAGIVATNGGSLYLTASADYTNAATALTLANGTLRRGGGHVLTWANPITLVGNATLNVDGGATLNYANPAGLSFAGANLTFAGSGAGSIGGPISLGTGSVTVTGGTWSVAPTNTYTGKTFLNGGTLDIPDLDALGPVPGSATPDFVTFNGGELGIATNATFSGGLRGLTITGTNAGTLYIQNSSTVTISSDLHGAGTLQKFQGTLILSGSNPFAGTLEVDGGSSTANDGYTIIASPTAIANVTNILQRNNNSGYSTLELDGTAGNITLPASLELSCRNNGNPSIENLLGDNTLSGNISMSSGGSTVNFQSDAGLLTLSGTNQYTASLVGVRSNSFFGAGDILVSGPILDATNGSTVHLLKSGSGTLTLAAANTYSGTTIVGQGLLDLTSSGSISSTGGVFVAGGALGGTGVINDNVTVQNSTPSGTIDALAVNGNFTVSGPLAVDVNRTGFQSDEPTVSGIVTNAGTGSIVVNNLGAPLQVGDRFVLFNKSVVNGASMTISGGGAQWNNNLATDGSITVASTVATAPTNITFSVSGNTLSLSWPAHYEGWILQVQTNSLNVGLSTNWVDIPGSGSITSTNIAINPTDPVVFYRLRLPQ